MTFRKQMFTRLELQKLQSLIYLKHSTKCLNYGSTTEIEFQILLESWNTIFIVLQDKLCSVSHILMVYEAYEGVHMSKTLFFLMFELHLPKPYLEDEHN